MADSLRCGYCGKELKRSETCFIEFGEPCEDEVYEQYNDDQQEREWEQQLQEHYNWQRRMGEID